MFVLDLDVKKYNCLNWTRIDNSCLSVPTRNQMSCNISQLIFVFGGTEAVCNLKAQNKASFSSVEIGKHTNKIIVYDTFKSRTIPYKMEGALLKGISCTKIIYFEKESQVLFYGGWSNKWHSNLYALSVQSLNDKC